MYQPEDAVPETTTFLDQEMQSERQHITKAAFPQNTAVTSRLARVEPNNLKKKPAQPYLTI